MVSVSIGGNDFKFADVVQSCVVDFLTSPTWLKDYCYDDSSVKANFTAANVAAVRARIATALRNVSTAMRNAGYADSQWTLLVQTYPSPIPRGSGFRYAESGYGRQSTGGCGFWNKDADWANDTALPTINRAVFGAVADTGLANVRTLNLSSALQRPPALREHRRSLRGEGRRQLAHPGRRRQDRVGQPDPHRLDLLRGQPLLHPGVAAPELLGAARHPQLRAEGLERRHSAQREAARSPGNGLVNGEPGMSLN